MHQAASKATCTPSLNPAHVAVQCCVAEQRLTATLLSLHNGRRIIVSIEHAMDVLERVQRELASIGVHLAINKTAVHQWAVLCQRAAQISRNVVEGIMVAGTPVDWMRMCAA